MHSTWCDIDIATAGLLVVSCAWRRTCRGGAAAIYARRHTLGGRCANNYGVRRRRARGCIRADFFVCALHRFTFSSLPSCSRYGVYTCVCSLFLQCSVFSDLLSSHPSLRTLRAQRGRPNALDLEEGGEGKIHKLFRLHIALDASSGTPSTVKRTHRGFTADKLGRPWCAQEAVLTAMRTKRRPGATDVGQSDGWVLGWKDGQPLYLNLTTGASTTTAPDGVDSRTIAGTPAPLVSRSRRKAAHDRQVAAAEGVNDDDESLSEGEAEEQAYTERTLSFNPAFG